MNQKKRKASTSVGANKSNSTKQKKSSRLIASSERANRPKAKSKTIVSAQWAVLNTAELLENVLIYVPFHTLLTSQRVCKLWRDTIRQSNTIREKLFFAPRPRIDRWAIVGTKWTDLHYKKITPTTILPDPVPIIRPWATLGGGESQTSPQEVYPVQLNPLLEELESTPFSFTGEKPEQPQAYQAFYEGHTTVGLTQDLQRHYANPSWWNMYLSNPPCTRLSAKLTFEHSKAPVHSATALFDLENPTGVTFGQVLDRALETEMSSRDGKKCGKGHGLVGEYLEKLDQLHGRPAYVDSQHRWQTSLELAGVVVPIEEEWEAVE